mmetsp:Transcript_95174/g.289019  ORF Transcript_95174/g.289019 Transcript_95174/m.289019 type:complete len:119 (-) Transcript_95174:548-904(-)
MTKPPDALLATSTALLPKARVAASETAAAYAVCASPHTERQAELMGSAGGRAQWQPGSPNAAWGGWLSLAEPRASDRQAGDKPGCAPAAEAPATERGPLSVAAPGFCISSCISSAPLR